MAEDDDLTMEAPASVEPSPVANADPGASPQADEPEQEGFPRLSSRTVEVRLIVVGCILLASVLVELALATFLWPSAGRALWEGVVLEMFTGREAGIPVALGGGAPPWVVAQISATQDIGVVCLAYPAFLWALHRFDHKDNLVMRRLRRLQRHAAKHKAFVHRYGPLGIFLFMLVPFLLNGPLFGAAMGRLAGITTRWLILPVVGATLLAAVAWSYAYDALFRFVADLDPRIPPLLTIVLVGLLVGWGLVGEALDLRREARRKA